MRATTVILFLLLALPAMADDLTGQASIIDGDTLEIHGTRIRLGGSTRRKAVSFAAMKAATSTGAALRRRTISISSSSAARSIAFRLISILTDELLRAAR
jgi:endonuclease YncB( thermonuclease family)